MNTRARFEALRKRSPAHLTQADRELVLTSQVAADLERKVRSTMKRLGRKSFKASLIDRSVTSSWFHDGGSPFVVLVFTEHGIGDPFAYREVFDLFHRVAEEVARDPWIERVHWDSINAGKHAFSIEPKLVA